MDLIDLSIAYFAAFNFPCMLKLLGRSEWPKLKDLYFLLLSDTRSKVRKTLAYSFHEVVKIMEADLSDDLLSELEEML